MFTNMKDFISMKSLNECRYVMMLNSVFDRELFPNDFDTWTVQKQYVWINENITTFFPNVPKSLLDFIPAYFRPGNYSRSLVEIPEWLDIDKYHRGQKFVRENYASLIFAKILGIMHVYSFEESLKPIIISKRSHTPYLGFKRYSSTIRRFFNWYNGEPWIEGTPAYKDMQFARRMHLMIQEKLHKLDNEQINNESKIAEPWCPDRKLFLKDFAACPLEQHEQRPYIIMYKSPYKPKGINNAEMASTQCSFISLILLCPEKIGVQNATNEDMEAFCHMWRCYGHYLGIENEHNFCRGSLDEIKQRTRDFYQYWIVPNFKDVTPEWEHMTRCFIESLNYYTPWIYVPYKVMALLAMDMLNINMTHLYTSMNYTEWLIYKNWRFLLRYVLKFSIFRAIINKMIRKIFDQAMNFSPEIEAKLKEKSEKQLSYFSLNKNETRLH